MSDSNFSDFDFRATVRRRVSRVTQQSLKTTSLAALILASMLLTSCATGAVGDEAEPEAHTISTPFTLESKWTLRLPEVEKVLYRGVVSFDSAGTGTASILYPAPNAAGLLAALITHGIINESMKSSQKTKLQDDADKVLLPYQTALARYSYKELMQQGLDKMSMGGGKTLIGYSEKTAADWSVESTPVFSMTQDQSAIIIDNFISIYPSGNREAAVYQKSIKAVSQHKNEVDFAKYWSVESGKNLKDESVDLFAESVDMALNDAINIAKPNNNVYKTFRYLEGNTERMERGQLISTKCDRVIIKNLRGAPMSIPVRREAGTPPDAVHCDQVISTKN